MNTLRFARAATRARPAFARPALQRRTYADVASDKIQLSLTLPHQVRRVFADIQPDDRGLLLIVVLAEHLQVYRCVRPALPSFLPMTTVRKTERLIHIPIQRPSEPPRRIR